MGDMIRCPKCATHHYRNDPCPNDVPYRDACTCGGFFGADDKCPVHGGTAEERRLRKFVIRDSFGIVTQGAFNALVAERDMLRDQLDERTLQHRVQLENAQRLMFAIETAIEQAESEGHHRYPGTDDPKPFFQTLREALLPCPRVADGSCGGNLVQTPAGCSLLDQSR